MATCVSNSGFRVHFEVGHSDEPLLLQFGSCRLDALTDFLTLEKLSPTGASIKLIGMELRCLVSADKLALLDALDLSAKFFPAIAENAPLLLLFSSFNSNSGARELKSASDFWRLLIGLSVEFTSPPPAFEGLGDWLTSAITASTKLLDFLWWDKGVLVAGKGVRY
jgi:hypothetical protein